MSKVLTKAYKKVFKEILQLYGFKQKDLLFIKQVNDEIIQTLYLFKGSTPNEFTINIGLFPFCAEVSKRLYKEGNFRIGDFIDSGIDWYEYDPFDYISTEQIVIKTLDVFNKNVYPVLNNVNSCYDYIMFNNNYEHSKFGSINWDSVYKLYSYLKIQDYETAYRIAQIIIMQTKEVASTNRFLYTDDEYKKYNEAINNDLLIFYKIIEAINLKDIRFINNLIITNETATKKNLREYGFKY